MTMRTLSSCLLIMIAALFITSCDNKNGGNVSDNDLSKKIIQVVTTTGMIADAVRNIGGDRVNVTALMGAGVDPHTYRASEGDVTTMMNADAIFYNGLHLEAKMGDLLDKFKSTKKIVPVSKSIPKDRLISHPGFEAAYDPHIWFDVKIWIMAVDTVKESLVEIDPKNASIYNANASEYIGKLKVLDDYVTSQVRLVPEGKRTLITAHDAFKYFGKSYGFEVKGIQGISTVTEAGTADMQNLANFITERKIPAVFVETSVPKRNVEALKAAVNARGFNVALGGELFSDAIGSPGTFEGTYIGMVRHNIDTIVKALK